MWATAVPLPADRDDAPLTSTLLDGLVRLSPSAHRTVDGIEGLLALAEAHGCELAGGDTTQGPLNLCITVFGEVPPGQALLRSGAHAGDDLYVSGQVGDARLALEAFRGTVADRYKRIAERMKEPEAVKLPWLVV